MTTSSPDPVNEKTNDWLCKCGILHSTGTYCHACKTSAPGILTPTYPILVTRENNNLRAQIASLKDIQNYINKCLLTKDEDKEYLYKEINDLRSKLETIAQHARKEALKEVLPHLSNVLEVSKHPVLNDEQLAQIVSALKLRDEITTELAK